MSEVERLVEASDEFGEALDAYIEAGADTYEQNAADWAYQRWGSVVSLIRNGASGSIAAATARGLAEEAIRWDWAASRGAAHLHNQASAAVELRRVRGAGVDPPWLVPPGGAVDLGAFRTLDDGDLTSHARIMGATLDDPVVAPLTMSAFGHLWEIMSGYAHANPLAALSTFPGGGYDLPAPLAAAVLHVAAAAATVVAVVAVDADGADPSALADAAERVSSLAADVHGVPFGSPPPGTPPKVKAGREHPPMRERSDLESLAGYGPVHGAAADGLRDACAALVAALGPPSGGLRAPRAVAEGNLGMALSCVEAAWAALNGSAAGDPLAVGGRLALEAGATWAWTLKRFEEDVGDAQRVPLTEAADRIRRLYDTAAALHVDEEAVDGLLGDAAWLRDRYDTPTALRLPPASDLMRAYGPRTGHDDFGRFAEQAYVLLSQFVHGTTLARWHVGKRHGDRWTSLDAPTSTIALAAVALGTKVTADAVIGTRAVDRPPDGAEAGPRRRLAELTAALVKQALAWLDA